MTEQIFSLLHEQPLVSIILGFLLAGFLAYTFRGVITEYLKKKLGLYSKSEILWAINSTQNVVSTSENNESVLTNRDALIKKLKEIR